MASNGRYLGPFLFKNVVLFPSLPGAMTQTFVLYRPAVGNIDHEGTGKRHSVWEDRSTLERSSATALP